MSIVISKAKAAVRLLANVKPRTTILVGASLVIVGAGIGFASAHQTPQVVTKNKPAAASKPEQSKPAATVDVAVEQPAATQPTPTAQVAAPQPAPKKAPVPAPKPTVPAPNYFVTKITRPNQVAPGTMTYSIKGGNGYYAGEFTISPATVTYGYEPVVFTVSTPDGKTVGMPTQPYDDTSKFFSPGMDSSKYKTSGSSFEFGLTSMGAPASGTYKVHFTSSYSTNNTNDIWAYHGWLTVIVP